MSPIKKESRCRNISPFFKTFVYENTVKLKRILIVKNDYRH
jgi:hypothetical protein